MIVTLRCLRCDQCNKSETPHRGATSQIWNDAHMDGWEYRSGRHLCPDCLKTAAETSR